VSKKANAPIHVGSTWSDKQDGSVVQVTHVTPYDVQYLFVDIPDIPITDTRRIFVKDFTLRSTPPNTTGALNAKD
jgi:hypothetical protein